MARKKTPGGTAGKGGVNPAPTRDDQTVRIAAEQLTMVPIDDLIPYANNAKKHGVTAEEMAEIITHAAFYAGWPNAWATFNLAKEVYDEQA